MPGGVIARHVVALGCHLLRLFLHPCRGLKIGQVQVHGALPGGFPVALGDHAVVQGDIQGDARRVVVLVARRTGDDPGQADGVKKRDGAVTPACPAEGILQRFQQAGGVFIVVRLRGQDQAADIAPHIPLGDIRAGAPVDEAKDAPRLFQHEGVFRGKIGVPGEQAAEVLLLQRRKAQLKPSRIPQLQQAMLIGRQIVPYHGSSLSTAAPTIAVGAAFVCVNQPLTAPMVTPSMKYF